MITSGLQTTLVASLSGIAFSGIGVSYKLGQNKGVSTAHVVLGLSLLAALATAPLAFPSQTHAPWLVWVLGATAGASQYWTIRMIGKALTLGPLSVIWCVVSLAFFPVVLIACLCYGDRLDWPQYLGLTAALGCVLMASMGDSSPSGRSGSPVLLGLLLAAILLCNSLCNFTQLCMAKTVWPGQDKPLLEQYNWVWMFTLYSTLAATSLTDLGLRRKLVMPSKWMCLTGGLGAASSLAGISLQNLVSNQPMSFPVNGAVGIVAAAVLSVTIFGERFTIARCWTIALGVLAVVLGNLHPQ